MTRLWRRCLQKLLEIVRVEMQGKYSTSRVAAVAKYSRETSSLRVAAVILLTPVPSLAITLLTELIPLSPPTIKPMENKCMLLRACAFVTVLSFTLFQQFAYFLPMLPFSVLRNLAQSLVVTIGTIGSNALIASRVGYPIPLALVTNAPIWMALIVSAMAVTWGKRIRERYAELQLPVKDAMLIWSRQITLVGIYPVYNVIYSLLPPTGKSVAVFFMPVLQLMLRVWYCQSLTHLQDELPELVVMSVDVFSTLFTMYCMQITPSLPTTLGLMAIDCMELVLSSRDVARLLEEVGALCEEMGSHKQTPATSELREQHYSPLIGQRTLSPS